MNQNDMNYVQIHIDYVFTNQDLLRQAFTRKSYSMENGGGNNELLEFIGDKVLDLVVVKYLSDKYGYMLSSVEDIKKAGKTDCYLNRYDEGKLTEMKARLVQKKTLSNRITTLGFESYLIMGKSDIDGEVYRSQSVREDLFEAIIGAVALDTNWDMEKIAYVVEKMLEPDVELENDDETANYIGELQEWALRKAGELPKYHVEKYSEIWAYRGVVCSGYPKPVNGHMPRYMCSVGLPGYKGVLMDFGDTQREARMNAAKYTMEYIKSHGFEFSIRDEIENPNLEDSINQLEILARRGYFSIPTYTFEETHDKDGNPHWKSVCLIDSNKMKTSGSSTVKKEAKKKAAYKMLCKVLKE